MDFYRSPVVSIDRDIGLSRSGGAGRLANTDADQIDEVHRLRDTWAVLGSLASVPLWAWLVFYDSTWNVDDNTDPEAVSLPHLVQRAQILSRAASKGPTITPDMIANLRQKIQAVTHYCEAALSAEQFGTMGPTDPEKIFQIAFDLIALDDPATTDVIWHLVGQLNQYKFRGSEWPPF